MDPNETLKRMRELIPWLIEGERKGGPGEPMTKEGWREPYTFSKAELAGIGDELAQLADELDSWLVKGGCLPEDWER